MATQEVKRESRNINFLLWKYKTKQPGEINSSNTNLMKKWRENQKIRVALKQMEDLNIKGDLQKQGLWIITEGPRTKDLCARCKYETVTLAIIFYLKFSNTKKRPLSHYKIARAHGLTEEIYSNIITKLGRFFQEKMALTGRIIRYNDF
ncbi:hypothetical protein [Methanobacterium formicicum]|uniref:Uncharacterized protein n=1 Tax=Methanobacterium formicicum TaxID=2162 RepID=A0A843AG57_METFO|nr:hypothetical protein [Methanobacterium formicicum]MBF4474552.1 hypothetical protein [Methanobacterium formicicum]